MFSPRSRELLHLVKDRLKGSYRFRPCEKLRAPSEYQRVKREGRRAKSTHFGINFVPNGLPYHRLGLVTQKRFWNAVMRNRIKRCLREWFRLHKSQIAPPGKDIVIIARPGAERLSSQEVATELRKILAKKVG